MPSGTPPAHEIIDQHIRGFALDTSIIRAAGYRFDAAPLSVLVRQLPPWMRAYLPDVVVSEVIRQQTDSLAGHTESARSEIKAIERAGFDLTAVTSALDAAKSTTTAAAEFRRRIDVFLKRHHGEVAPMGANLAEKLFEHYFAGTPPFGKSRDRKSEFPDAAALLTLESLARRKRTKLIAVSADKAWRDYAATSNSVYCVGSLDELTKLFVSNTLRASAIERRLGSLLGESRNGLLIEIERQLEKSIADLGWSADAYSGMSARLEPEVSGVQVEHFEAHAEGLRLWMSPDDDGQCVVEVDLQVRAEFHVSASFYITDPFDKDEVAVGSGSTIVHEDVTITAFVTLNGELLEGDPAEWDISVEFEDADRLIEAGEIELDNGDDYEDR